MNDEEPVRNDGTGPTTDGDSIANDVEELDVSTAGEPETASDALIDEHRALQDRHLRLAAEYDNYRKRSDRERS